MASKMIGTARIGRDTELRNAGGYDVADISLAFTWGKKDGDNRNPVQWVKATMWGNFAKAMAQYLTKGSVVEVVLEDVHIEAYQRREGGEGFNLVGKVLSLEIVSRPKPPAPAPAQQQRRAAPPPARPGGGSGFDDMDDDIPY